MARILVVAGASAVRLRVSGILKSVGYEVGLAADADAASCQAAEYSYDLVLMGEDLPGGVDLLQFFAEQWGGWPVVLMTGASVVPVAQAIRPGVVGYFHLGKPLDREALLQVVARAVQARGKQEEERRTELGNRRYQAMLEELVEEESRSLERTLTMLRDVRGRMQQQERLTRLGQMVGGIAHDFNNVLTPIVGLPSMLLRNPRMLEDKDGVVNVLQDIQVAAQDAQELVRRLRAFYCPAEPMAFQTIRVAELLASVQAVTRPVWQDQAQSAGKQIRVLVEGGGLGLKVYGNETALREVLINLVINGIQAIGGQGVIELTAVAEAGWVVVRVRDTGAGMSREVQRMCFEPLFSTKGAQGTGLGLAMSHEIVQRHGGEIAVESATGCGTTFTIRLPHPDGLAGADPAAVISFGGAEVLAAAGVG